MVWIKINSNNNYKTINKLKNINIVIKDIRYESNSIYILVDIKDVKVLKKYLILEDISIVKYSGIYSIIDFLKRNYIFLISIFIGLIILFLFNNLIIDINILHEDEDIRELLIDELDSYGIKSLSFKKDFDELQSIKNEILDKYSEILDWIEFEISGMVLNVRVEERIITDTSKDEGVCNIVASKDGLVSAMVVTEGEAVVSLGDYVRKGDILISGSVSYNGEVVSSTCAQGEVLANTFYTVSVSVPLSQEKYTETGKVRYNLVYEYNGNKNEIFKSRIDTKTSEYIKIFSLFNFNLYIEREIEIEKMIQTIDESDAENYAINTGIDNIYTKLGSEITIIFKKVLKKVEKNGKIDIDVFIAVEEKIGTQEEIKEEGID